MKKIFIMMFVAAAATNINAQLVVDSLGRVGIGTNAPKSLLTVGQAAADTLAAIHCQPYHKQYGIRIKNTYNTYLSTEGL